MRSLCFFVPGLLCLSIFLVSSAFEEQPLNEESVAQVEEVEEDILVSNETESDEVADFDVIR